MKIKLTFLTLFVATTFSFGQTQVQKINRDNFIGQKVKFLRDEDNTHGYMNFGKSSNAYPWLSYTEFKERTATFVEKNKDLFTLKIDDNGELVYFKHYSFSDIPNNIGFFSLLDSARTKYLNKTYFNSDFQECKIVAIEFAEDTGKYSQLFGPYNVFYTVDKDTNMVNVHFTETYGPENGYTYDHQKERVFENIFKSENPFKPLTKSNIDEKFYIDIDKMDNKKTYIHKNLADKDLIKYNLGYGIDYENKAILTKVVLSNGIPKISFISNFYGSDWIFHSYVKIKIGDVTKQTTPVKGKTEVLDGGKVVETNYYSLPTDLAILKWIADNYTKEITVRFYGKDYYDDITIPMSEKLAIKETYDLYNLLKTK
jgi:hypothetical protein